MLTPTMPANRRTIRSTTPAGLTLLEVLIALVLLGALAAIVTPTLVDRLDERAFEAAADGTNEQLMMARAHAQATGEAVEVTYSPSTGNVQARLYAPWDAQGELDLIPPGTSPLASTARGSDSAMRSGVDSSSGQDSASARASSRDPDSPDDEEAGRSIAEGWANRTLGRGIRIGTHRPFGENGLMEEICMPDGTLITVSSDEDEETLADLENGQDVRLAVFMPDGSAMLGDDLWLDDGNGRCGRITINPWSGLAIFQRLADLTDEALTTNADEQIDDAEAAPRDERDD